MRHKGDGLIMTGLLFVAAALFLTAFNMMEQERGKQASQQAVRELEQTFVVESQTEEAVTPDYVLNPKISMPAVSQDGTDYIGLLQIPKLGLELPVIREWSYESLRKAPCCYSGSVYMDDMVICAHNYSSHFGNISALHLGDSIEFKDMDGNLFRYRVGDLEILQPSDLDAMEESGWDLTLFTCTVGGQSRVTVRCERVEE